MKVFVTGAAGQLGHDVIRELLKRGHEVVGSDVLPEVPGMQYVQMDITDAAAVNKTIIETVPDAVIHCAAWTAVDAAEETENRDTVYKVNVCGTQNIADSCKATGAKLMYISTDYVFDGQGERPWKPDDHDFSPLNVYGETKRKGEVAVTSTVANYFVVRISWVFGKNGNNFVKTMLNVGRKYQELKVVCDQIGAPTYTYDLAVLLSDMISSEQYGCYHVTNEGGYISWYEFAREIFRQAELRGNKEYGEDCLKIHPVTTQEYGISKAVRPENSRMDTSKLAQKGFQPLPEWKDALKRFLDEIDI